MHTTRWLGVIVGIVVGAAALSGCSAQGNPQVDAATAAAVSFSSAARSEATTACALLAPETASELTTSSGSCSQGLADADLPAGGGLQEAEVYGLDAIVRLAADTIFLARFEDGWRVTAAGCTPQGDGPFDCDIKGG